MRYKNLAKRLLNRYWSIYTGLGDSFLENLQGMTTLKIYQADEMKAKEMDKRGSDISQDYYEGSDYAAKFHKCDGYRGLRRRCGWNDRGKHLNFWQAH